MKSIYIFCALLFFFIQCNSNKTLTDHLCIDIDNISTLAHKILRIEQNQGIAVTQKSLNVLNSFLKDAVRRIHVLQAYTREDVNAVLSQINQLFKDHKFKQNSSSTLLSQALENKEIACFGYTILYYSIGEVLDLPITVLNLPDHISIRWKFDNGEYINWETTIPLEYTDMDYVHFFNISFIDLENGIYLNELRPNEIMAKSYFALALAYADINPEKAVDIFQKAIEVDPYSFESYNNLGNLFYYKLAKNEEAKKMYIKAISIRPNAAEVHNNLGILMENSFGEFEIAKNEYQKAIFFNPQLATAYNNLGIILARRFDSPDEARAKFEKALSLQPDFKEAYFNLMVLNAKQFSGSD